MNTHRGVVVVAEHGLAFLREVSLAEPNRVRRQVMGLFVGILGWVVGAGAWYPTHDAGVVAGWRLATSMFCCSFIPQLLAPSWSNVAASVVIRECVVGGLLCGAGAVDEGGGQCGGRDGRAPGRGSSSGARAGLSEGGVLGGAEQGETSGHGCVCWDIGVGGGAGAWYPSSCCLPPVGRMWPPV